MHTIHGAQVGKKINNLKDHPKNTRNPSHDMKKGEPFQADHNIFFKCGPLGEGSKKESGIVKKRRPWLSIEMLRFEQCSQKDDLQ